MPENDFSLRALDKRLDETISLVNKIADRMDGFSERVTNLLDKQDHKIDALNVIKDKLNYDNGRLFSDNRWMKAIFAGGLGLVLTSYAGISWQYAHSQSVLEQRVIEMEKNKK